MALLSDGRHLIEQGVFLLEWQPARRCCAGGFNLSFFFGP